MFLPININLESRRILMVGGGNVALHKLQGLLQFQPDITVLAPSIKSEIKDLGVNLILKEFEPADLKGFHLIYACTDDREVNREVKKTAAGTGLLVNVADDPENCDFISPAIYKNQNFSISVSSGATDTKGAVRWRNKIRKLLEREPGWI